LITKIKTLTPWAQVRIHYAKLKDNQLVPPKPQDLPQYILLPRNQLAIQDTMSFFTQTSPVSVVVNFVRSIKSHGSLKSNFATLWQNENMERGLVYNSTPT